jgi:predicted Zn-dependent protease
VINGYLSVSDASLVNVIAHELGHLIGLDHTQLDSTQGLASSNYPLMYPIAYRTLSTLHDDDIASVSALYPGA